MKDTSETTFSINELIVVHSALEAQIDDCEDFLSDATLSIQQKDKIAQTLQYSKSALQRLNAIFTAQNINPYTN